MAYGDTKITKLGIRYLATVESDHFQINTLAVETTVLSSGTGKRR